MITAADGCHAGWVVAFADAWPSPASPRLVIVPDFAALLAATAGCAAVVVDMPIGLPSGGEHRYCDEVGRQMLGGLGATRLFFAPPRGSLAAGDPVTFQQRHRAITGRGAGLPVWGIVRKLREIDAGMTPDLQSHIYEFHPELAWQHLAGEPLRSKHQREGIAQRLALLRPHVPRLDDITRRRVGLLRKDAALDDLLDALVGLGVAQAITLGPDVTRRIPERAPQRDARGLRMEVWF